VWSRAADRVVPRGARPALEDADGEAILRREIQAEGKGRATINGALVPVSVLRDLSPRVARIHGQHEPQGLLDPETHLQLLDRHAGLAADADRVAGLHRVLREVEASLEILRRGRQEGERRREMLEYQAAEIEKAQLKRGKRRRSGRRRSSRPMPTVWHR
jgi:DNA repair protein RecN (Recombination protein N)